MLALGKKELKPGIEWLEKYVPVPQKNEVLVKVLYTSICGTDLHIYEMNDWAKHRIKEAHTMGHEFVGRVVALGEGVTTRKIGDLITAETHIVCNNCEYCLNNQKHICENTVVLGVDIDGCFAQYISIPEENAILNDEHIPHHMLSVLEPLGNAIHVLQAQELKDKTVAVVGVGPIGIMAVDGALALGAKKVVAIDVVDYRLNLAKTIGAHYTINAKNEDVEKRIFECFGKNGVDVVCEMSGHPIALKQALHFLKPGGHLSILGIPNNEVSIDITNDVVFKGIHIHGITGREMFNTWDIIKTLLREDKLHLDKVITHVLDWTEVEEGMRLMASGDCGKVVLKVSDDE